MAIKLQERHGGNELEVTLTGTIIAEDYLKFVPAVDGLVKKHGSVRMLVIMRDFHGWTPGAMWEDAKFAAHHYRAIKRLAVVGEKLWQAWITDFCKPFTAAEVRYFDQMHESEASAWIAETSGAKSRASP